MSPEQTIIVAKMCDEYKQGNTLKYPPGYVTQYESCKKCTNWHAGSCKNAQDILRSID